MKKCVIAGAVLSMSLCMGLTAYAGEWKQDEAGYWYVMDDGSFCTNEWKELDGAWYHFDAQGYMQTGWYEEGQAWYYLEPSTGAMLSNTSSNIDGTEYQIDASGMATEATVVAGMVQEGTVHTEETQVEEAQTETAQAGWNGYTYTSVASNYQITFPTSYYEQDASILSQFFGTEFANSEFYVIRNDGWIQVAGAYYENPYGLTAAQMCDALQERYTEENQLTGEVVGRDQLEIGGSTYYRILIGVPEVLYCDVYLKEADGRIVMIMAVYEPESQNEVDQILRTLQNVR